MQDEMVVKTRSVRGPWSSPKRSALGIMTVLWLLPLSARAATFYVAPTGSDDNSGTALDAPFATMARGQQAAAPGDTVYFRGGTYKFTSSSAANGVALNKSGTSGKRINYWAYQAEVPVFDFSGMTAAARITGLRVTASWIHLKGLEVKLVPQNITTANESWGVHNVGSNNIFELLNLHHNMGPGFFLGGGADNLILNCDSHHNYDPKSIAGDGENADGFGCHPAKASDTGNVYRGIRAWWNTDDGFDAISAQAACVVENSWAWYNGYLPDKMTEPMRKPSTPPGNGNGFKLGGFGLDASGSPVVPPRHRITFSLAFLNVYAGFFANYHTSGNFYFNNTGFGNKGADFDMMGLNNVNTSILTNNVALGPSPTRNMTGTMSSYNSWDSTWGQPVTVTEADFQSVSIAGVDGPRQPDGSLPVLPFMRLAPGSDLIDKGVKIDNVSMPQINGTPPDLGAFESNPAAGAAGGGAGGSSAGGRPGSGGGSAGVSAGGSAGENPTTSGGTSTSGGAQPAGGTPSSTPAGAANVAGSPSSAAGASSGSPASAGAMEAAPSPADESGCGCRTSRDSAPRGALVLLAAAGLVASCRRQKRRSA